VLMDRGRRQVHLIGDVFFCGVGQQQLQHPAFGRRGEAAINRP
jgi:hypothetical protein